MGTDQNFRLFNVHDYAFPFFQGGGRGGGGGAGEGISLPWAKTPSKKDLLLKGSFNFWKGQILSLIVGPF